MDSEWLSEKHRGLRWIGAGRHLAWQHQCVNE